MDLNAYETLKIMGALKIPCQPDKIASRIDNGKTTYRPTSIDSLESLLKPKDLTLSQLSIFFEGRLDSELKI